MICRIADLYVSVPKAGGLAPRCGDYLADQQSKIDIVIQEEAYEPERYPGCSHELACYMESGRLFYNGLLRFDGMMLHASAVEYEGMAYLFSGPCGVGKSTHTRLWQQVFGPDAQVFNDDKPALRLMDGQWFAYGTPWCGKDGINQNKKVPLAGICFLKQGKQNCIHRMTPQETATHILSQTFRYRQVDMLDLLLNRVEQLVRSIPVYVMENVADTDCVKLSCETMQAGAKEAGLCN